MNYYRQTFKRNLALFFIFNIIFCIAVYATYTQFNSSKIKTSYENDFSLAADKIDSAFSSFSNCVSTLDNSVDMLNYTNAHTDWDRYRVYSLLNRSLAVSSSLYSACYNIADEYVITTSGSMTKEYFANQTGVSEDPEAYLENDDSAVFIAEANGQKTLNFIERANFEGEDIYYIQAFDANSLVFAVSGQCIITFGGAPFYYGNITRDEANDICSFGKKYVTLSRSLNFADGNFGCVFFVPHSSYVASANKHILLALPMFLIVFALTGVLIYIVTNKNYQPINEILKIIGSAGGDVGDDEIGSITNAILSLNMKNSRLTELMENYKQPIENTFLINLLNGTLTDSELRSGLESCGIAPEGKYVCAILDYSDSEQLAATITREGILTLKKSAVEFLKNTLPKYDVFKITDTDFRTQTIIISVTDEEEFFTKLKHALLTIETKLDVTICGAVGKTVNFASDIYKSHLSAKNLIRGNRILAGRATLLTPTDTNDTNVISTYSPSMENTLVETVLSGNSENMRSLIHEIVNTDIMTQDQFDIMVIVFNSTINRILYTLGRKAADVFPPDTIVYLELKECRTREEFCLRLIKFFDCIIADVKRTKASSDEKVCTAMIEFIHSNYQSDISLLDLAEHLNMSQSYASRLFKQLTGNNFKDTLSNYRFLKAKELMEENPFIKIKDVAAAVGLNSTDSLSRIFMKNLGMSPSDYIKRL